MQEESEAGGQQVTLPYEPTLQEQAALEAHSKRKAGASPRTRLKVNSTKDRKAEIYIDHPDVSVGVSLIEASFGTTDWKVAEALAGQLGQLANVGGEMDNNRFQQAMALAQGVQPKDEVEAMLATQMAAIHLATMEYAGRLHRSTSVQVSEAYERSLTRLSRTFTAQVDALKKYRTKGEQRVIVEHQHVHVHPGGQAVVGTFNQTAVAGVGRGADENEGQSHEPEQLLLSERTPVLSTVEAIGLAMQGSGHGGEERLSVPRRDRRSAKRAA